MNTKPQHPGFISKAGMDDILVSLADKGDRLHAPVIQSSSGAADDADGEGPPHVRVPRGRRHQAVYRAGKDGRERQTKMSASSTVSILTPGS